MSLPKLDKPGQWQGGLPPAFTYPPESMPSMRELRMAKRFVHVEYDGYTKGFDYFVDEEERVIYARTISAAYEVAKLLEEEEGVD